MKAEQEKTGLKHGDKRQDDLQDAPGADHIPEGLVRERKGPLDLDIGCNEAATQVPGNGTPETTAHEKRDKMHRDNGVPPQIRD